MRRRLREVDADARPPEELLRFPGERYFDDGAEVWEAELAAWLEAREEWAAAHGLDVGDAFGGIAAPIPDAPLDVRDL